VTVASRREAVPFLRARGLSPHRTCSLLGLYRATFQYQARPDRNAALEHHIQALAQRSRRDGYRRRWALLRRRGQHVNKKRVQRIWTRAKRQGRKVHRKRRVVRAVSTPVQATPPGHVWTDAFMHDAGLNGTALKVLTVMDECTREGLAIAVAPTRPAAKVLTVLDRLVREHSAPQFLRRDNGPAFLALAVRGWLVQHQTATLYIDPGCPWQHGYEERVHGTVRDACLNPPSFHTGSEARVILTAYRREYHAERPHSRLGYRTPAEFKRDWLERQSSPVGL
jgi:putative transposase